MQNVRTTAGHHVQVRAPRRQRHHWPKVRQLALHVKGLSLDYSIEQHVDRGEPSTFISFFMKGWRCHCIDGLDSLGSCWCAFVPFA